MYCPELFTFETMVFGLGVLTFIIKVLVLAGTIESRDNNINKWKCLAGMNFRSLTFLWIVGQMVVHLLQPLHICATCIYMIHDR